MKLVLEGGVVYRAHFMHEHVFPAHNPSHLRYKVVTHCTLHEGECPLSVRPCITINSVEGLAKCSNLDQFERHLGLKLSFERALKALNASRDLRQELWTAYFTRVKKV
jgi:hypothetical protein